MKSASEKYPFIAIFLLLLSCIHFEYHTSTSSFTVPGLLGGVVVLSIICIVQLFRLFNAVANFFLRQGWLKLPLNDRFDILIPIGIFAVAIKAQWFGPKILDPRGSEVDQWVFRWSDSTYDFYFILMLVVLVLLIRIVDLFNNLNIAGSSEQSANAN